MSRNFGRAHIPSFLRVLLSEFRVARGFLEGVSVVSLIMTKNYDLCLRYSKSRSQMILTCPLSRGDTQVNLWDYVGVLSSLRVLMPGFREAQWKWFLEWASIVS